MRKLIVGSLTARYIGPVVEPMISHMIGNPASAAENGLSLTGFLIGVLGLLIVELLYKIAKVKMAKVELEAAGPIKGSTDETNL